jgi:hypothetical protein
MDQPVKATGRSRLLKATVAVGLVILGGGILLPILWSHSYPIRMFSLSMLVIGVGIGLSGMSFSRLLPPGTRTREYTFIGSGMIGMAMLVFGLLTLVEIASPV